MKTRKLLLLFGVLLLSAGCQNSAEKEVMPEEVDRVPLDDNLFVQGLEISPEGELIAGLGLYQDSRIVEIDPETGASAEVAPGPVAPESYFGEGISYGPNGDLYQLTWHEGKLFVRDPVTFEVKETIAYEGEGAEGNRVLNGIAHIEGDLFYITGKEWSNLYTFRLP